MELKNNGTGNGPGIEYAIARIDYGIEKASFDTLSKAEVVC